VKQLAWDKNQNKPLALSQNTPHHSKFIYIRAVSSAGTLQPCRESKLKACGSDRIKVKKATPIPSSYFSISPVTSSPADGSHENIFFTISRTHLKTILEVYSTLGCLSAAKGPCQRRMTNYTTSQPKYRVHHTIHPTHHPNRHIYCIT
jgi:hypothetical protein